MTILLCKVSVTPIGNSSMTCLATSALMSACAAILMYTETSAGLLMHALAVSRCGKISIGRLAVTGQVFLLHVLNHQVHNSSMVPLLLAMASVSNSYGESLHSPLQHEHRRRLSGPGFLGCCLTDPAATALLTFSPVSLRALTDPSVKNFPTTGKLLKRHPSTRTCTCPT